MKVAKIGNRQGQRTDLAPDDDEPELPIKDEAELLADLPEVTIGKTTRDVAAKAAGFSSTSSYRQAKSVVERGALLLGGQRRVQFTPSAPLASRRGRFSRGSGRQRAPAGGALAAVRSARRRGAVSKLRCCDTTAASRQPIRRRRE